MASSYAIVCKWGKAEHELSLRGQDTVATIREMLAKLTRVAPGRQKLLGLKTKGTNRASDDCRVADLVFKGKSRRFKMIGVPDDEAFIDKEDKDLPEVVNDLDFDYMPEEASNALADPAVRKKMLDTAAALKINLINSPRKGKPLLVLDLDYTLFDMKSTAEKFEDLKRPFSDHFLKTVYPYYDIVVWSQTSWKWLEIKLTELGFLTSPHYKICFVLDKTCMFRIASVRKNGQRRKHQVKSLGIIWEQFKGQWGAHNTVHVDDLGRNFALNPQSGLKIKAYRNAHENRAKDKELLFLAQYLVYIARRVPDFRDVKHGRWKKTLLKAAPLLMGEQHDGKTTSAAGSSQ